MMPTARCLQRRFSGVELWALYSPEKQSFLIRGPIDAGSDAIFAELPAADAEFRKRIAASSNMRSHWYGQPPSDH
jgi:hypothetical protein